MPLAERGLGVTFQTGCSFEQNQKMLIVMTSQFNLAGPNGHSQEMHDLPSSVESS
jgi:hypothetical protein